MGAGLSDLWGAPDGCTRYFSLRGSQVAETSSKAWPSGEVGQLGDANVIRRRLALSAGIVCATLAFGAFFYSGENHEVESRATSEKAIYATAEQRGTTYAAVISNAGGCCLHPGGIEPRECEQRSLYGKNLTPSGSISASLSGSNCQPISPLPSWLGFCQST
jgi:hypothetical protein